MKLVWNKFDRGDVTTSPSKNGTYFVIQSGFLTIAYYDEYDNKFVVAGSIWVSEYGCDMYSVQPTYWADKPDINLPDEMLIEMIK